MDSVHSLKMTSAMLNHKALEAGAGPRPPSAWVARFAPLIGTAGPLLDLASGSGRHGRLFLGRNDPVVFVDIDVRPLADLARHPGALVVRADLERGDGWPFGEDAFAGVVVTNYLYRPLLTPLCRALRPGGVLIYETFAIGNARYGRPATAAFLLRAGELLDVARAAGLTVVAYEHGVVSSPRTAVVQRACAVRPSSHPADLDGDPDPAALPDDPRLSAD